MKKLGAILFLMLLTLGLGFVLGVHVENRDVMKLRNDQAAVENLRLPRARYDFNITKGRAGKQKWKMVTLENKLDCVLIGSSSHKWGACNWDKWNAEKEKHDKAQTQSK